MSTTYYTDKEWGALSDTERHEVEKRQLFMHLEEAGSEAAIGLLDRLQTGRVQGDMYWDYNTGCGCVLGTLKYAQSSEDDASDTETSHWDSSKFIVSGGLGTNGDRNIAVTVVEELAFNIAPGDTPDNNENARLLADWTREWLDTQEIAS